MPSSAGSRCDKYHLFKNVLPTYVYYLYHYRFSCIPQKNYRISINSQSTRNMSVKLCSIGYNVEIKVMGKKRVIRYKKVPVPAHLYNLISFFLEHLEPSTARYLAVDSKIDIHSRVTANGVGCSSNSQMCLKQATQLLVLVLIKYCICVEKLLYNQVLPVVLVLST